MADTPWLVLLLLLMGTSWLEHQAVAADGDTFTTHEPSDTGAVDQISITTILASPFVMKVEPEADEVLQGNAQFEGMLVDLLSELAERGFLPANYEIVLVKDNMYGSRNPSSGEWSGMIGEVVRQEVDMALAPLSITDLRKTVVAFSKSWAEVGLTLVVNKDDHVENLESLINRTDMAIGTMSGGSTYNTLSHEQTAPFPTLWSVMGSNASYAVDSMEKGLELASKGGYAFITENYALEWYLRRYCRLESVGFFLPREGYGFAFPKGSSLLDGVDMGILALHEDGKIEELRHKWMNYGECSAAVSVNSISILGCLSLALLLHGVLFQQL